MAGARIYPMVGTLTQEFVYPGLATPENPAPDRVTPDQQTSAQGLNDLGFVSNLSRSSMWFIAFAVLVVLLWFLNGGD